MKSDASPATAEGHHTFVCIKKHLHYLKEPEEEDECEKLEDSSCCEEKKPQTQWTSQYIFQLGSCKDGEAAKKPAQKRRSLKGGWRKRLGPIMGCWTVE